MSNYLRLSINERAKKAHTKDFHKKIMRNQQNEIKRSETFSINFLRMKKSK